MFHCTGYELAFKVCSRFPPFSLSNVQGYEVFWRFELYFMRVKVTRIICCISFTLALCNCTVKYVTVWNPCMKLL